MTSPTSAYPWYPDVAAVAHPFPQKIWITQRYDFWYLDLAPGPASLTIFGRAKRDCGLFINSPEGLIHQSLVSAARLRSFSSISQRANSSIFDERSGGYAEVALVIV